MASKSKWSATAFAETLGLDELVGRALLASKPAAVDELDHVRALKTSDVARLLDESLLNTLRTAVIDGLETLNSARAATSHALSEKFAAEDGAFTYQYASLATFYGGLEALVGPPSPHLDDKMRAEHVEGPDADIKFLTTNYKLETTPRIEFWFVVEPTAARLTELGLEEWPPETMIGDRPRTSADDANLRKPTPPSEFEPMRAQKNAELRIAHGNDAGAPTELLRQEVIACRLYTGPLFQRYNTALRGLSLGDQNARFRAAFDEMGRNYYTTTLHVINSSIVKLGKLTQAGMCYRGLAGGVLPPEFWTPNQFGVCGGVDTAFMSTSRERDVVINYAKGAKAGTLIELQMGMVDRGADVEWLSQYQGEKEVLFAPLTGIEVIGSRVVESLLVVEVRLNINLRSLTIEQVLGKMKASYVSLLSLIDEGLQRDASASEERERLQAIREEANGTPAEHYNEVENYKTAVNNALDVKRDIDTKAIRDRFAETQPFKLTVGNLRQFYEGLESVLGGDHVEVSFAAMAEEHLHRDDSQLLINWSAPHKKMATTAEVEWYFVTDPIGGLRRPLRIDGEEIDAYPIVRHADGTPTDIPMFTRDPMGKPLSHFADKRREIDEALEATGTAPLSDCEFIGARLQTTPMFFKYATVLRCLGTVNGELCAEWKKRMHEATRGNTYAATLMAQQQAMCKLARIFHSRIIYRGVVGRLPSTFFEPDATGFRGGLEFAATAATLNLEYAISASRGYATDEADIKASERSKPAVIFEIHCSGADQAADLAWLSCFPAEAECTLPSWSLLELTASRVYKERNLLILEVRPQLPLGGHVGEGKEGEPAVAGESVVAKQLIANEWHECVGLRGLLRGARARNESWPPRGASARLLASLGRE